VVAVSFQLENPSVLYVIMKKIQKVQYANNLFTIKLTSNTQ
jgi:hypothetical protein